MRMRTASHLMKIAIGLPRQAMVIAAQIWAEITLLFEASNPQCIEPSRQAVNKQSNFKSSICKAF